MKSEFELAFNEISETRKLSKDVIIEALEAALISAYRRNVGVSSAQIVNVEIDEETGETMVLAEKEVVEDVQDVRTEVELQVARNVEPEAQLGDMVMVDSTPRDFGRIAAQTAKQVILQRMREAERSAQYEEYRERVGDLVTGTVQSVTPNAITVGLGRTEALLPRSQQMSGERYRTHDKVRAYIMEVNDSPRGPQIILSRAHRNMLRRLLEYEVPEIYSGTVDIKNIAREPGARSKVAVVATREGVDPVGACVGMRGVRIQSIVRELNDEKIDVIEWNPDQSQFIAKALSPARVNSVFLDDDPIDGRTAVVVVPDDQLSLAIGREGQNARLAAKLTGWRIDIKSVTEAAEDALENIKQSDDMAELAAANGEIVASVERIMEKKASNRPVMPEDYQLLAQFTNLVENQRLEVLLAEREIVEARRAEIRERVPSDAYQFLLEDTSLPLQSYNVLVEAGFTNFGELIEQVLFDEERLLKLNGLEAEQLDKIKEIIATEEIPEPIVEEVVEEEIEVVEVPEAEAQAAEELAEGEATQEETPEKAALEEIVEADVPPTVDELTEVAKPVSEPVEEAAVDDAFDEDFLEEVKVDSGEQEETLSKEQAKRRRRQLVFDEELGEVVSKRRRKESRSRTDWQDAGYEDLDDLEEIDDLDDEE